MYQLTFLNFKITFTNLENAILFTLFKPSKKNLKNKKIYKNGTLILSGKEIPNFYKKRGNNFDWICFEELDDDSTFHRINLKN